MEKMISYTLYFGAKINDPDRDDVSAEMFSNFLKQHVDRYFEGYTVTIGAGAWKGKSEKCFQLEILVPYDINRNPENVMPGELNVISDLYKETFDQESVMIKVHPALVQF